VCGINFLKIEKKEEDISQKWEEKVPFDREICSEADLVTELRAGRFHAVALRRK